MTAQQDIERAGGGRPGRRRAWAMRAALALTTVAACALPSTASAAGRCGDPDVRPWCDTSLRPDRRAGMLLAELTRSEKISLLAGDSLLGIAGGEGNHTGVSDGVPRLGLPTIFFSDGPVGPRQGKATAMPSPLGLAATWSRRIAGAHAGVVGDEVRNKGNDFVFAPTVETMRVPLAGRSFENFGEDPFLGSQLAVSWIRGVQREGVIATVKHFAPNSQEGTGPLANLARPGFTLQALGTFATVGNRMSVSAEIDERTLREIYLPQFEAAVRRGKAGAVMCAYNKVGGRYACEHPGLLEETLRDDWGFRGVTIADYGGAHSAAKALNGGLDFEPWPGIVYSPLLVEGALAGGASMADVDRHVRRYLRALFAGGALDRLAYVDDTDAIDRRAHQRTARRISEQSITLLRNDDLLPLRRSNLDSIAVIGAAAARFVTGGGSSEIDPFAFTTPLDAITRIAGRGVDVRHDDGSDPGRAAALARVSDVAVVVTPNFETEGVDRACLSLGCPPAYGDQDALIAAVADANPRTAVVLETGAPVLTPWRGDVGALLEAWYPGSAGGAAIARVLFGKADPGGRLPATFPRSEAQLPTAGDPQAYPGVLDRAVYDEGVLVGYRHYDQNRLRPAYPFGHGLSYARFRYKRLRVVPLAGARTGARVSFTVRNAGRRAGYAVPQLYVGLPSPRGDVPQPPRQLRGFRKLRLEPGERRRVRLRIGRRDLAWWDAERDAWRVARGCYPLWIGRSSRRFVLRGELAVGRRCGPRAVRTLRVG